MFELDKKKFVKLTTLQVVLTLLFQLCCKQHKKINDSKFYFTRYYRRVLRYGAQDLTSLRENTGNEVKLG